MRQLFVLVFLHVETRRVYLSPATEHPTEAWVKEQAAAFVKYAKKEKLGAGLLMHDRDTKFTASFDKALRTAGTKVVKTSYRSPNVNAFVERFIQRLGQECLDYFVVFGARHLNHLCAVFVDYYHQKRPHQGKDNELLPLRNRRKRRKPSKSSAPVIHDDLRCETKLGGLLRHYNRRAA